MPPFSQLVQRRSSSSKAAAPKPATALEARCELWIAAAAGQTDQVHDLLCSGVPADFPDEHGRSPLHAAIEGGRLTVANILLAEGALVNRQDEDGVTPLLVACR